MPKNPSPFMTVTGTGATTLGIVGEGDIKLSGLYSGSANSQNVTLTLLKNGSVLHKINTKFNQSNKPVLKLAAGTEADNGSTSDKIDFIIEDAGSGDFTAYEIKIEVSGHWDDDCQVVRAFSVVKDSSGHYSTSRIPTYGF